MANWWKERLRRSYETKWKIKWSMHGRLPFTFAEGNKNIKVRGRCWWLRGHREVLMVEEVDLPLRGGITEKLVQSRNFLSMSVYVFEILNRRWCRWLCGVLRWHWWRDLRNGASACKGADGGRGINSDVVTGLYGEKNGTDSQNVTSVGTKCFMLWGL